MPSRLEILIGVFLTALAYAYKTPGMKALGFLFATLLFIYFLSWLF